MQKKIEHQKAVADILMGKLDEVFQETVVAGGAPRQWRFGLEANDIDIFVYGDADEGYLTELLGFELYPISEEDYLDARFDGYEGEYRGEKIQILMSKEPVASIHTTFPINMCQAKYKNGVCEYTDDFRLGYIYSYLVVNEVEGILPDRLIDKYMEYFPHYTLPLGLGAGS